MKITKNLYENNISEDIIRVDDTLQSEMPRISKKLNNSGREFFFVVLDDDEKMVGIITKTELFEVLEKAKECSNLKIGFKDYVKKHITMLEGGDYVEALKELKKSENKGIVLIKNRNGNYIGKILLSIVLKKSK